MVNDGTVGQLINLSHDLDKHLARVRGLERDLATEKRRADLLAQDKADLQSSLDLERTRRRWQRLSDGQCPDETRVLVRGKDKYVAFGTRNPNGTWLSGRMMLDFDPVEWMLVPD